MVPISHGGDDRRCPWLFNGKILHGHLLSSLGGTMHAMIKRLRQYDPSQDDYVADVQPESDPQGAGWDPDIDSMILHSKKHGFYLQRRIAQVRKGRVWMTASRHENPFARPDGKRRCLTTIRPLSRAEVIRMILASYLPDQENAKGCVLEALASAGIIDQG